MHLEANVSPVFSLGKWLSLLVLDGDLVVFGEEPLVSLIDSVEEASIEIGLLMAMLACNRRRLMSLFERVLHLHCNAYLARGIGLFFGVRLVTGCYCNGHHESLAVMLDVPDARHDIIHALSLVLQLARAPLLIIGRSLGSFQTNPLKHSSACLLLSKLAAAYSRRIVQADFLGRDGGMSWRDKLRLLC